MSRNLIPRFRRKKSRQETQRDISSEEVSTHSASEAPIAGKQTLVWDAASQSLTVRYQPPTRTETETDEAWSCNAGHQRFNTFILPREGLFYRDAHLISACLVHKVEGMHLARTASDYFSRPEDEMDLVQRLALWRFQEMESKEALMKKLNATDCREALSSSYMLEIIRTLNAIFFLNYDSSKFDFFWTVDRLSWRSPWACSATPNRYQIWMHPVARKESPRKPVACERFGRLLALLIYSFFSEMACRECSTFYSNFGYYGLGPPFRLVAEELQQVARRLFPFLGTQFGIPIESAGDLRKVESLYDYKVE